MDKQDLIIEINYELDMLKLVSKLADFAVINGIRIGIDTYTVIFWDIQKRANRIAEMVRKLENL